MKISKRKYEIARARSCKSLSDLTNAGISKATIARALRGSNVKPETVGRIAKILEVDVLDILQEEN